MLQKANIDDLDQLVDIENISFDSDRFSRRNLKYLLTRANSTTLVEEEDGRVQGYAIVLYNNGTSMARLYSLGVHPDWRGKGIGKKLLVAAEQDALQKECAYLRLEVREDNVKAIRLYEKQGYKKIHIVADYYADHQNALKYEKQLVPHLKPTLTNIPYYEQTLDFTCGPASLLMVMKALDTQLEINQTLELKIWRESTTIFMTSGLGGCSPFGLALAAFHRNFDVELYLNDSGIPFIDSVRSDEKKHVIQLIHQDQLHEIQNSNIKFYYGVLGIEELEKKSQTGIPIVLISSYRIYHEKTPHWIVVTGFDEHYVYVHDSFIDREEGKSEIDCMNMAILKKDFIRMSKYGRSGLKAVLILKKKQAAHYIRTIRK